MTLKSLVFAAGVVIGAGGFLAHLIAILAMGSYELRKRLPFKSPFQLQGMGCYLGLCGMTLIIVGSMMSD